MLQGMSGGGEGREEKGGVSCDGRGMRSLEGRFCRREKEVRRRLVEFMEEED